jgi:hypothetical protein
MLNVTNRLSPDEKERDMQMDRFRDSTQRLALLVLASKSKDQLCCIDQ